MPFCAPVEDILRARESVLPREYLPSPAFNLGLVSQERARERVDACIAAGKTVEREARTEAELQLPQALRIATHRR